MIRLHFFEGTVQAMPFAFVDPDLQHSGHGLEGLDKPNIHRQFMSASHIALQNNRTKQQGEAH